MSHHGMSGYLAKQLLYHQRAATRLAAKDLKFFFNKNFANDDEKLRSLILCFLLRKIHF